MSRKLKRVPMNFDWPLKQIWGGYLNPFYKLAGKCPDCEHGFNRAGGRPDANAALFDGQWYGREAAFDPVAYGAEPLLPDHPVIWERARYNISQAPSFYMTPSEQTAERKNRQKAGIDLLELYKTTDELKAELDHPASDLEDLEQPGLVKLENFRAPAIAREAARLHALWCNQWCHNLIQIDVDALVAADRLWDFTRRPRTPEQAAQLEAQGAAGGSRYWLDKPNGYRPTAAEVNAWSLGGMGHGGSNQYTCLKARCAREGVPLTCARCGGSGKIWPTPEIKRQYDEWKDVEPPTGDGYQLWEDVSEGSPVSPVFATLDELCTWAAEHATTFAQFKATADEWKDMLDGGIVHHREGDNVFL